MFRRTSTPLAGILFGAAVSAQAVTFLETPGLVDMSGTSPAITNPPFSNWVAIGVVDLNGDRRDDIARIHDYREFSLEFQNAPGASFTNSAKGLIATGRGWSICAGDVDGNGINDLVVGGNARSGGPSGQELFLANGDGTAHARSMITTNTLLVQGTILSDLDGDHDLDLFACDDVDDLEKYLNNGSGVFTSDFNAVPTAFPAAADNDGNYAILATDYDNDGDIDYYLSKCEQGNPNPAHKARINRLFERGPSGYTEVAAARGLADGAQTWCADFGDIDNDGDLDAFMLNHESTSSAESGLYLNDGSGNFTNITVAAGLSGKVNQIGTQALFRDFDNDGDVDLLCSAMVATARSGGELEGYDYFRNNGDGTFTELLGVMRHANMAPVERVHSFAVGDLNHDGFLDLYAGRGINFVASSDPDLVMINQGNANGFLALNLAGSEDSPSGIGARVEAHGPWGIQVREVRGGEGYGIMNSLNAHFGLGAEDAITRLVVKWPTGTVDEILDVKGNRFATVHEGTGSVAFGFADWIGDHRPPGDLDGADDSPDGDPVPNLFEQLMGTDPNEPNGWEGMSVSLEEEGGTWLLVELDRVPVQDVEISMEVSTTGSGWGGVPEIEVVEDSPTRYAARVPVTVGNPTLLARLKAVDASPP